MTKEAIIKAFDEYISKTGCRYYKEMYVGITNAIERRLFSEHRVDKIIDKWIYAPADNENISREVENHYLALGMRGGSGGGGGDGSAKIVYCYVITFNTRE